VLHRYPSRGPIALGLPVLKAGPATVGRLSNRPQNRQVGESKALKDLSAGAHPSQAHHRDDKDAPRPPTFRTIQVATPVA
jgi:hypothetical protein